MLEVIARTTVTRPEYRVFETHVVVHGFDKLTPRAARAALEIAGYNTGEVWCTEWTPTKGGGGYYHNSGYRVYPKSARKIFENVM